MTIDLDVLEGLQRDATPGEWEVWKDGWDCLSVGGPDTTVAYMSYLREEDHVYIPVENAENDAALMIAAKRALPDLIAAARERDGLREYYEARIEVDYQLGTLAGVKRAARNRLLKAQAAIEARQALKQETQS